jgi:hypothetical protein
VKGERTWSKKLNGVECELGDGDPLHFVLNVEKHGKLGASRWPGAEMDWKRISSIGFAGSFALAWRIQATIHFH